MQIHGSCASQRGLGVLLVGPPGSGKSDLVLRLLTHGFELVADDRVEVEAGIARAPSALAGLLEVRGLGIFRLPFATEARLALVVDLAATAPRLPIPERYAELDLPLVHIDAAAASAPDRVALALAGVLGRVGQVVGAFAA
jgi:HPr kinase/phosphorylase